MAKGLGQIGPIELNSVNWEIDGDAAFNSSDPWVDLTDRPLEGNEDEASAVWLNKQVDLTKAHSFEFVMERFGNADGFAVVFRRDDNPDPATEDVGGSSSQLGVGVDASGSGLENFLAVMYDDIVDNGDRSERVVVIGSDEAVTVAPAADETVLDATNPNQTKFVLPADQYMGTVNNLGQASGLDRYRIDWVPRIDTNTNEIWAYQLNVYQPVDVDGSNAGAKPTLFAKISYTVDQVETWFGDPPMATLGFTASTGRGIDGLYQLREFDSLMCFTRGTLIKTLRGEIPIEELNVGDRVLTVDLGYQELQWIGSRKLDSIDLSVNPRLKPIRIKKDALGPGFPQHDLTVSPQHRILVRSKIAERMFDLPEVLIPANKLLALDGIDVLDCEQDGVEYFHMLFDDHQIVWSNGALTESLFTGPQALKSLSPESRAEIETLFPEICEPGFEPVSARPIPEKGKHMKQLAFRHQKNRQPLFSGFE